MTATSEHQIADSMTRVVIHLERALDLLLSAEEHTVADALLAAELHEVVVTIHEVGIPMLEVDVDLTPTTVPDAVQNAVDLMDSTPPQTRPLWLLILRGELASIQRSIP